MQWLVGLLSGWLPIGVNSSGEKKSFGEWSGKIVWVVGIVLACIFIVKAFESKNITTVGQGGTQIINQSEQRDMVGFGCNIMRLYVKGGVKTK